jgi:hypothetical protein
LDDGDPLDLVPLFHRTLRNYGPTLKKLAGDGAGSCVARGVVAMETVYRQMTMLEQTRVKDKAAWEQQWGTKAHVDKVL